MRDEEERRLARIISFSEVVKCPEFRLDPEHYIPRHRGWGCRERGIRHGSRRRCKGEREESERELGDGRERG